MIYEPPHTQHLYPDRVEIMGVRVIILELVVKLRVDLVSNLHLHASDLIKLRAEQTNAWKKYIKNK